VEPTAATSGTAAVAADTSSASPAPAKPKIGEPQFNQITLLLRGLNTPTPEAYQLARETMTQVLGGGPSDLAPGDAAKFVLSANLSVKRLAGYATLDDGHLDSIQRLLAKIRIYTDDPS